MRAFWPAAAWLDHFISVVSIASKQVPYEEPRRIPPSIDGVPATPPFCFSRKHDHLSESCTPSHAHPLVEEPWLLYGVVLFWYIT